MFLDKDADSEFLPTASGVGSSIPEDICNSQKCTVNSSSKLPDGPGLFSPENHDAAFGSLPGKAGRYQCKHINLKHVQGRSLLSPVVPGMSLPFHPQSNFADLSQFVDARLFNAFIQCYLNQHITTGTSVHLDRALEWYARIQEMGYNPNTETFAILIEFYCKQDNVEKAYLHFLYPD